MLFKSCRDHEGCDDGQENPQSYWLRLKFQAIKENVELQIVEHLRNNPVNIDL